MGRFWWSSVFDATLGFPGEAPPPPRVFMSPLGRQPDGVWLAKAARVLHGAETFAASGWIAEGMTPDALHDTLLSIAQRGNSTRPIAARVQSNPARVARLLGADNLTAHQARDGCAYNLAQRPSPTTLRRADGPVVT
jgi:hypothetical protein